jgi:MraZ protein
MSAFKGSYLHSIDNKGRINLPAKLKKYVSPDANDTFVVTRGFEKCIVVYPLDEWSIYEKTIRDLPTSDPGSRFVTRVLLQYAQECQLDAQSRIMLPQQLISFAGIQNDALILGVLERIEIWNSGLYDSYVREQQESYAEIAEKVFQNHTLRK